MAYHRGSVGAIKRRITLSAKEGLISASDIEELREHLANAFPSEAK